MVAYDPPPVYEHVDSDDESLPPPPPPFGAGDVSTASSDKFNDHELEKSVSTNTAKPVKKWRLLKREAEHALIPQNDHEAVDNNNIEIHPDESNVLPNDNNNVPMQGHFRGIHNAQQFDEEEAGMDEIEVPSSSVVARLNTVQHKDARKKKSLKLAALGFVGLAALIAIIAGSIIGSNNNNTSPPPENTNTEIETEIEPNLVDVNPNPNLDTEAGRFLLNDPGVLEATKVALADDNSVAMQALDWAVNDNANAAFGFGQAGALETDEQKLNFMQRFAAASLGKAFNSDEFVNSDGWMSDKDVCEWNGINCDQPVDDGAGQRRKRSLQDVNMVWKIDLRENNAIGVLPAEIAMFTEVTQLILFGNKISGSIPVELCNLTKLTAIDVYDNDFSGEIPACFGNLINMIGLYMSKNNLNGQLPASMGDMTKLEHLWVDDNKLTGGLPDSFVNLESLKRLDLDKNDLFSSSTFPTFLLGMESLTRLSMREVFLGGEIPIMSKGNLSSLTILYLDGNRLTGTLTNEIAWLQSLERLTLSNNAELKGEIPASLGQMPALRVLDLSGCRFEGLIPEGLSEAGMLEQLYLNGNYLTGAIPASFGELQNLNIFKFEMNSGMTEVPGEVCALQLGTLIGGCDINCDCCTDDCN